MKDDLGFDLDKDTYLADHYELVLRLCKLLEEYDPVMVMNVLARCTVHYCESQNVNVKTVIDRNLIERGEYLMKKLKKKVKNV